MKRGAIRRSGTRVAARDAAVLLLLLAVIAVAWIAWKWSGGGMEGSGQNGNVGIVAETAPAVMSKWLAVLRRETLGILSALGRGQSTATEPPQVRIHLERARILRRGRGGRPPDSGGIRGETQGQPGCHPSDLG